MCEKLDCEFFTPFSLCEGVTEHADDRRDGTLECSRNLEMRLISYVHAL